MMLRQRILARYYITTVLLARGEHSSSNSTKTTFKGWVIYKTPPMIWIVCLCHIRKIVGPLEKELRSLDAVIRKTLGLGGVGRVSWMSI